jgi:hypothetical protein
MEQYPIPAIHTFPNTPLVLCPTPSSELDRRGVSEESHLLGSIYIAAGAAFHLQTIALLFAQGKRYCTPP